MTSNIRKPLLMTVTVLLCILGAVICGPIYVNKTLDLKGPLTNLQYYEDKQLMFFGGTDVLYASDLNLTLQTRMSDMYNYQKGNVSNINKVLVIDHRNKRLIVCGTGFDGKCGVINIDGFADGKGIVSMNSTIVQVSRILKRPAQGLVTDNGNFTIAVTYGIPVEAELKGYKYPIVRLPAEEKLVFSLSDPNKNFRIYYKDKFQLGGYTYFVTNQPEKVGSSRILSKVVRICQNDSEAGSSPFLSYVDTFISCNSTEGKQFNLIQNAIIIHLEETPWFVGTFANGSDPENVNGDAVICKTPLQKIVEQMREETKTFAANCTKSNSKERYLADNKNVIENGAETYKCTNLSNKYADCNTLQTYTYTTGSEMLVLNSSYKLQGDIVTSLTTAKLNNVSVLLAGTLYGNVTMLNINETDIEEYDTITVDKDFSISGLYQHGDDELFVMSTKKIFKYRSTDCSEFGSCSATMQRRNPLCGWCLFTETATRKEVCQNGPWLPSDSQCMSLSLQPKGVKVSLSRQVEVTVEACNIPDDNQFFQCEFRSKSDSFLGRTNASRNNCLFNCSSPSGITKHTEAVLKLILNRPDRNVSLASAPFLFFNCSHFDSFSCKKCTGTEGADCSWSLSNVKCQDSSAELPQNEDGCPYLSNSLNIIPSSVPSVVNFTVNKLQGELNYNCTVLNEENKSFAADVGNERVSCNMTVSAADEDVVNYRIVIEYSQSGSQGNWAVLDDEHNTTVTVYDCKELGTDCSRCKAFTEYKCGWNSTTNSCEYNQQGMECPAPEIIKIVPDSATQVGQINVTLEGTNFGFEEDKIEVKLCNILCKEKKKEVCKLPESLPRANNNLTCQIVCTVGNLNETGSLREDDKCVLKPGPVSIGGKNDHIANVSFYYKVPNITNIKPRYGPKAGGTVVTLSGSNLGVGNLRYFVQLSSLNCNDPKVMLDCPEEMPNCSTIQDYETRMKIGYSIVCTTPSVSAEATEINVTGVKLLQQTAPETARSIIKEYELQSPFSYLQNPEVDKKSLENIKGIVSGGTRITVKGQYLNHAQRAGVVGIDNKTELNSTSCYFEEGPDQGEQRAICPVPRAPDSLESSLLNSASRRRKRAADCDSNAPCVEVKVQVFFDGVTEDFLLKYFLDPSIDNLTTIDLFSAGNRELTIYGQNIRLVASEADVNVTIGLSECTSLKLEMDSLTCLVPKTEPKKADPNSRLPEVNVKIGNLNFDVGYVAYKKELDLIVIIAGAGGGGVLAIVVIVLVIALCKCRKIQKKANEYQKELAEIEMNIVKVVREEFLDMHTTMSTVNRNLVEQGFPYHSYQQYACNVMFSVDYLWTEPVMTDDERIRANKGMEQFESLIYNKFFLFSVISTLEKEKRFFIKEKSNFAGNLCAVLMGKMDYLEEIMKMLLSNHVQETPSKKQKTLFRRCESITEKLLSNWLSLCLYPHIKAHSSSPLYLLYVAIQKTMESGPIDAITHDAKYTLCEEKLLKKWSSTAEGSGSQDIKFEAKTLTLNLVVDNGEEIFKCKVLDCDTISQVKSKCMAQIYVNFPASQLSVHPDELALEWHEGFGGALKLRDEDNTSKQDGHWLRLNTLAHYNVKDDSNMALVDPTCDGVKEEDYVNLTHVNIDVGSNGSFDSSEPLAPKDEENPNPLERWHLVKKEEETSKQGKSAIAELYLNRLLTTKQCVIEYVRTLWDTILDKNRCPPPVRFLFEYLDELGERGKVDPDTLHAWKSHSYAIRVWGSLMKMPALLFDIEIPGYMDDSLEVISQVFIESFSPDTQKVTKDSASWKLIFNNEVISLRDKVKDFYKNVKVDSQTPEEYRQYMEEVKRYQQETKFNKVSALYRLYKQIKPFIDDIVEDLSESQASSLQLDKKLEKVMEIMEAEEE